jgi:hypothetical protein
MESCRNCHFFIESSGSNLSGVCSLALKEVRQENKNVSLAYNRAGAENFKSVKRPFERPSVIRRQQWRALYKYAKTHSGEWAPLLIEIDAY